MSSFDLLQCEVALLIRRVAALEKLGVFDQVKAADARAAMQLAAELGLPADTLNNPGPVAGNERLEQRKRLARALKAKGWSLFRIARVFDVWERSVTRWLA